ncbi:uncharacterized mitochondrial protein AtMg00310-like [Rosa rugosa]|uniref:uncharacterized mitochondrial protein AtMg00310-like n=1 Tax=Rosa rugosa TaxID=74645 RepID=UPI002B410143|nr:uncharacterized mitochondrial protein AtMg00310-like [Rosa rugosa]
MGIRSVHNPGSYLGLPTIWGRSKVYALAYVKDNIAKKILGWNNSHLSQAGKEIMIKSVAMAVPAYTMSVFKFPTTLCNKINYALADFWWGSASSPGIHWKNWGSLSLPKSEGGMGFCGLADFNLAFLAKQGWRILSTSNALWVSVLKSRYVPHCSFLEATRGTSPSSAWASILAGRAIMSQSSIWQIGSGQNVDFWRDNWIQRYPSFNLLSHMPTVAPIVSVN